MKIILFVSIVVMVTFAVASPYQLIESESATIIKKNHLEYKLNGVYETGHIPVGLMRFGLRYGVLTRLEAFVLAEGGHFMDQDETRFTSASATLKYHFLGTQFFNLNMFAYGKYRHSFSDVIVVPYDEDDTNADITHVISPFADEGRDVSAGLLGRNSLKIMGRNYIYMIGLEYTRAMNRDYGDFDEDNQNIGSLMFVPEYHFGKGHLMFAFENKVSYWSGRGYMYSAMPQIRWEFSSFWVFETGVVVPIAGAGNNYRVIAGFTYGRG